MPDVAVPKKTPISSALLTSKSNTYNDLILRKKIEEDSDNDNNSGEIEKIIPVSNVGKIPQSPKKPSYEERLAKQQQDDKMAVVESISGIKNEDPLTPSKRNLIYNLVSANNPGQNQQNSEKDAVLFAKNAGLEGNIRNLKEKIILDKEITVTINGQPKVIKECSVEDLLVNNGEILFAMKSEDIDHFMKNFNDHPERMKSAGRKKVDKIEAIYNKIATPVGVIMGLVGMALTGIAISGALGGAIIIIPIPITIILGCIGAIFLIVGIVKLAQRTYKIKTNDKKLKTNIEVYRYLDKLKEKEKEIAVNRSNTIDQLQQNVSKVLNVPIPNIETQKNGLVNTKATESKTIDNPVTKEKPTAVPITSIPIAEKPIKPILITKHNPKKPFPKKRVTFADQTKQTERITQKKSIKPDDLKIAESNPIQVY